MLISKAMNGALNEQIGNELAASNQYLSIAVYFDGEGLPALSKHFHKQSAEERAHALRIVKYIGDASGTVKVPAIPAPTMSFKSAEAAVKLSYDSEMMVTKQILALVNIAVKENDHLSKNMLEWFVNEQREEVSSMDTLLRMVRRAGEHGLFFVESFLVNGGLSEGADGATPAEQA